jgi:putative addiction module CopG family antidote
MNVSLGKLEEWVKDQVRHGDYETTAEVVREAVRRMKSSEPAEPDVLQQSMDEAERSGFARFSRKDWEILRTLARTGRAG